jgi:arginine deiminase
MKIDSLRLALQNIRSYILKHHPRFKDENIPLWVDRDCPFNIEGGDELVLSKDVLAIVSKCINVRLVGISIATTFLKVDNESLKIRRAKRSIACAEVRSDIPIASTSHLCT